jgi:hypothetical protein
MAGNVYLPENKDGTKPKWVWDFIEECAVFDKGTYDDQVDALSQAVTFLLPGAWRAEKAVLDAANAPVAPTPAESRKEAFNSYKDRVLRKASRRFSKRVSSRALW